MRKPKTQTKVAHMYIAAINVQCPGCEEPIPAPDGSQVWDTAAFVSMERAVKGKDYHFTCPACQAPVVLPLNPIGRMVK